MIGPYSISFATLTLFFCTVVFSIPHQLVLGPPKAVRGPVSTVFKGDDSQLLFRNLINELDRGLPSAWEHLVNSQHTVGTSAVEVIHSPSLHHTLDGWGLDDRIRSQVFQDVELLINMHAEESVYVSHKFDYNVPDCQGGELPVCMYTLMVTVRQVIRAEESSIIEIGHIYIHTWSSTIQQMRPVETCHSCWFHRCCHSRLEPRDLSFAEISDIQAVLSTSQAWWANENLPEGTLYKSHVQMLLLQDHLQQFVYNYAENEDVFRDHDEALVTLMQGSMQSTQQNTRSISMSFKEQDLVVLETLLSPCLKKASVNETAHDIWRRFQYDHDDKPLSLECATISQRREILETPVEGCNKSMATTLSAKYSWLLLSSRADLVDCIYIIRDMDIGHIECEALSKDPTNSPNPSWRKLSDGFVGGENASEMHEGSIVRWSVPQAQGYFYPVRYITQWSLYTSAVNKVLMDVLRYSSAMAYLRIPILPRVTPSSNFQDLLPFRFDVDIQDAGTSMMAIGKGMSAIAEGWSALAGALGNSVSETVRREICLGFQKYEHTVKVLYAQAVDPDHFVEVVESLIKISQVQVPAVEDLRTVMVVLQYSSNVTWSGETTSYTSDDGFHWFFYFYKYANELTNKIDIVFGMLSTTFTIGPDVLIVNRKKIGLLGFSRSEEVLFRNVPHVVTANDTALLNLYFEIVAYRKLALATHLPFPEYPSLEPLCTR
ncbi:hypothetical protein BGX28_004802 [Mortierella sp. GBA30]|nr:hypothetical protein BGX28_004802 [Mortierella sp. GBA30]